MTRTLLPQRRFCETFTITHWGRPWQITVGFYDDQVTPGEVFVSGGKTGTEAEGTARDGAILLSLALQHGVPLNTIRHAITRNADGSPSTIVGAIIDRMGGVNVA